MLRKALTLCAPLLVLQWASAQTASIPAQAYGGSCIGIAARTDMVAVAVNAMRNVDAAPIGDACRLHRARPGVLFGLTGTTAIQGTPNAGKTIDLAAQARLELASIGTGSNEEIAAAERRWDASVQQAVNASAFQDNQYAQEQTVVGLYVVTDGQSGPRIIHTEVIKSGTGMQINPPTLSEAVPPGKMLFVPVGGGCDRYMRDDVMARTETAPERNRLNAAMAKLTAANNAEELRAGVSDMLTGFSSIDSRLNGNHSAIGEVTASAETETAQPWRVFPADACPADRQAAPAAAPRTARRKPHAR